MTETQHAPRAARSQPSAGAIAGFAVPGWIHWASGWQQRHRRAAIRLGDFDTRVASEAIADIGIDRPIYIAGLARSGTTMLLELLAAHGDVGTHRYRDFPPIFTPWLWNRWLARIPLQRESATERAHGDGVAVTSASPEAFEEPLWMAFFDHLHERERSAVLDATTSHPAFERFYAEHIRKILAVRGATRYAAKGNYNLTRLGYLHKLFADAKFVIPVRDPVWHIASLIKQQRLFEAGETAHPRALEHMRRVGHFEFGLDRRPIHTGDTAAIRRIERCWTQGREVEGWAHYWASVHGDLADRLDRHPHVNAACRVVRYEDLCRYPDRELPDIYAHCGLAVDEKTLAQAADRLRLPGYYEPAFSASEHASIRRIAGPIAARFGYRL